MLTEAFTQQLWDPKQLQQGTNIQDAKDAVMLGGITHILIFVMRRLPHPGFGLCTHLFQRTILVAPQPPLPSSGTIVVLEVWPQHLSRGLQREANALEETQGELLPCCSCWEAYEDAEQRGKTIFIH